MFATIGYPFFTALLLSIWLMPLTSWLSRRLDAVDRPDVRKLHGRVVPRMGGLAIVAGMFVALALFLPLDRRLAGLFGGMLVVASTGAVDDLRPLPPAVKFLGQLLAASIFVFVGGGCIRTLGDLFGTGPVGLGPLAPAFTIFCMTGVMNALNLSDGLDGLAGGISAIACVFLGLFAYTVGDGFTLVVLAALFGGVLGFLRYNSFPAVLFMGDSGSLLLGYTLSAAAVFLAGGGHPGGSVAPVTVGAVLALPVLDTLLVMARRIRHGKHPFYPDRSHLHHRLLGLGLPHEAAVPILYLCAAAFGLLAWFMRGWPESRQLAAVGALGAAVYGVVLGSQRMRNAGIRQPDRAAPMRHGMLFHRLAVVVGRSTPAFLRLMSAGLFLPLLFLGPVSGRAGIVALGVALLLGVLYPWRMSSSRSSIRYGLIYAALACYLSVIHFARNVAGWVDGYLIALAGLTLVWVFLKAKFKGQHRIFLVSGFEILVFGVTWFIPVVLAPPLGLPVEARNTLLLVCIEATVFQMAFKILIRKQPSRNRLLAGAFLLVLLFLGLRAFWSNPVF